MAFLDANDYDLFGPYPQDEEEPYLYGFTWIKTRRTNYELRVTWGTDASGAEAPPATWVIGADTYRRVSGSPERSHGAPLGRYTALYRLEGIWTPDIP